ncbi:phosphoribosylanthranilate isomerase [Mangrovibacillus cuniculi]|uniref:N-(5'-phosphoribosyl)anthranilate isomerase n=1 Tax=Mangrovibacillus cuniculi TaxID=2593652 RepID=A0A7S8CAT6_9BACI|nr:phosphoribosylanthranilate isomerase [Mangrovibacillus cuniculi]QPC46574.1 phosphoribosylanthranilate isomerase [Mangrovibacillus cuniculi]
MIKICGITKEEEAVFLKDLPVDLIGFVFAKSKRQVTTEQARKMGRLLSPYQKKVGVFVNEEMENVNKIAIDAGLDFIQLHGEETNEDIKKAVVPVIKAIGIRKEADFELLNQYKDAAYLLVDHRTNDAYGGTGSAFDWSWLNRIPIEKRTDTFVAGGINPSNVGDLSSIGWIHHIDVSSGVEGISAKEKSLVEALIKNWKGEMMR